MNNQEQELLKSGKAAVQAVLATMTPEQKEAVQIYQLLVQQIGEKVAKKIAPPGTIGIQWEHGAAYLDIQAQQVVEDVIKRAHGEMGLSEFVAFAAGCAGYQAGIVRAKGFDLPDDLFEQAGKIFAAGMQVTAVAAEVSARSGLTAPVVPGVPVQKPH